MQESSCVDIILKFHSFIYSFIEKSSEFLGKIYIFEIFFNQLNTISNLIIYVYVLLFKNVGSVHPCLTRQGQIWSEPKRVFIIQ